MSSREDLLLKFFHYGSEDEKNKADERHMKYLKKKGRLDFGNPNDVWKISYQRNMTQLAILILIFVYSNDDDDISAKELRKIKRFYKKKRAVLTAEDFKDIHKYSAKKFTNEEFIKYMEENDFHESIFDESVQLIHNLIQDDSTYIKVLSTLVGNIKEKK